MVSVAEINCNWVRSSGCHLKDSIQTKIANEDFFIRPDLEEIISEDRSILLLCPAEPCTCELHIRLFPRFKIEALSIVCNAPKIELFVGANGNGEYLKTVYGAAINQPAVTDDVDIPRSYRYDIEVDKSGVVETTTKLFTNSDEICLYGILVLVAPNPNGITTMMPCQINMENVQHMLEGTQQKLSPSAERCKLFMEHCNKNASSASIETPHALIEKMKLAIGAHSTPMLHGAATGVANSAGDTGQPCTPDTCYLLRTHIDMRIHELKTDMTAHIDALALEHSAKLDLIMHTLEELKK